VSHWGLLALICRPKTIFVGDRPGCVPTIAEALKECSRWRGDTIVVMPGNHEVASVMLRPKRRKP
jgi:hypothetical protein